MNTLTKISPQNNENERLRDIIEHIPEFIYEYVTTHDSAGYFTYASDSSRDIYDAEPYELMEDADIAWKSIHPEDLHQFTTKFIKAIEDIKIFTWQGRLISRKSFRLKWVKITAQPVKVGPDTVKWYGVIHDITSFKSIESELQFAKERAEREAQAKEDFLATMSHDIRTPLGGILGMTDLLLLDASGDQREYLDLLKHAANNLNSLVNNILDFSKLSSNEMVVNPGRISLQLLLNSLKQIHQFKANDNHNDLIFQIDSRMPEQIYSDEMILSQILNNLLSNANKFTRNGQVHLRIKVLELQEESVRCKVTVQDTGVGIDPDDLNTIFEKFKQVGSGINNQGGTGLGLTITRQLVKLLGGDLSVRSELGKGSSFNFSFESSLLPV